MWCRNQKVLYFIFILVLILPNLILLFTEEYMAILSRISNIVLPLGIFWFLMTCTKKPGKMLYILFPFIFFNAFQIVLLYLFGESVIAVDMFLNLATTNSGEACELLNNLTPALITIFLIYIPVLVLGVVSIVNKDILDKRFRVKQRKVSYVFISLGLAGVGVSYFINPDFQIRTDIYPVNVCYNAVLAVERSNKTEHYKETSDGFMFNAHGTRENDRKEIYIFVIGETARACNFSVYGYGRNTTPHLSKEPNLFVFKDALTQSNTTHKSVPMLMSAVSAENYDSIYYHKGIFTAFKEAGFATAFFSNQRRNNSFIDFFGLEADTAVFIKDDYPIGTNVSDKKLLPLVENTIKDSTAKKIFIVLHTYGSHFNYMERYGAENTVFTPDKVTGVGFRHRNNLINAYDNTIHFTDDFLYNLINLINKADVNSAILYTSDHGEDILDDRRKLFLHASPIPSYYQLHVPYIVWVSDKYRDSYPEVCEALHNNITKPVSTNLATFHTLLSLSGIDTPYKNNECSVAEAGYKVPKRYYLNDHNLPKPLDKIGLKKEDVAQFKIWTLQYP